MEESLRVEFPESFLWGAATSAHQVEGGNTNSDWWRAEQSGTVRFASGDACEHYTRYEADFDLAVELGHSAHRLSVEWARIEPEPGKFDAERIAHYVAVLSALKARGLKSFVTLHHFTNPGWLADRGGWLAPAVAKMFEEYVRAVVPALAPYVDVWLTINEPTTVPLQGYVHGEWPPHHRGAYLSALRVIDAQAAAHRRAYQAIHELVPDAQVGYTTALVNWRPRNPRSLYQRTLAKLIVGVANHRFSDKVNGATDLIGVQYYFTLPVGWAVGRPGDLQDAVKTDLGWDIVPDGLCDVTLDAWKRYGKPIYITENGLADADDSRRAAFIRDHLVQLRRAMQKGADVRGYLHWSLLDNFEWAFGFEPRFGLVEVNYATQERNPRASALTYRDIIKASGFEGREANDP